MNLLAIDTSSRACALAVSRSGHIEESFAVLERRHSQEVLGRLIDLMQSAGIGLSELDAIIFGQGPGSFTGVRIAVGVVQGLGFGLDIPVVPVSSLAAIAQGTFRESGSVDIVSALHARADEFFMGAFHISEGCAEPVIPELIHSPTDAAELSRTIAWTGAGDGWGEHGALLASSLDVRIAASFAETLPRGTDLIALGERAYARGAAVAAENARPVYLREVVARTIAERQGE
mgnify:CR=1 FL=1|jgi:tRNA threonylcarbamoyladenosine biosynthesis protein TsaB